MSHNTSLRVMTYNIGGGRKNRGGRKGDGYDLNGEVLEVVRKWNPDVLGLQECIEWTDVDLCKHSYGQEIADALGHGQNYYFGRTLSMKENFHVRKEIMLYGLYNDWQDWAQGNAISMKYSFTRLGEPGGPGDPQNIALYRPPVYEGSRDTDPRYAVLARANIDGVYPYVVCTHLTTLVGERGGEMRELPGRLSEAQGMRYQQAKNLIELLRPKLEENQVIVLMGDFNAGPNEASVASVLEGEGGFHLLSPRNNVATHPKLPNPIDHVLIYPPQQFDLARCSCWIDDSDVAHAASDHLPVVADLVLK
jgi:endonuclease/exonuclease/phosphatase family metal-dependent hydrolase